MKKSFIKHFRLILFAGIVVMLFLLTLIGCNKSENVEPNLIPTEGLEFELVESGDDYTFSVVGLGTATDQNIVIPATYKGKLVTSIGKAAFKDRKLIKSITIPNTITSIGASAFYGCENLIRVEINDLLAWCNISFADFYANPLSIAHKLYLNGQEIKELELPNELNEVKDYIFYGANNLYSLKMPDSIDSIGFSSFYGCTNIENIVFSNTLSNIGYHAFANCKKVSKVELLNNKINIEEKAFENCVGITTIIGDALAVSTIAKQSGSASFDVVISSGETIPYQAFGGCEGLKTIQIPNSVRTIGSYAFYNCRNIKTMIIPNEVENIGTGAFAQCVALEHVSAPNNLKFIGDKAFDGCTNLVYNTSNGLKYLGNNENRFVVLIGPVNTDIINAQIENKCRIISAYAFNSCENLTSIALCESIQQIGTSAFQGCYRLVEVCNLSNLRITLGDFNNFGGIARYALNIYSANDTSKLSTDTNGNILYTNEGDVKFIGCVNITSEIIIPNSVTSINSYAFYNNKEINAIVLPDNVNNIGNYAFTGCNNIESISGGAHAVSVVAKQCGSDGYSVNITAGDSIEDEAFSNCINMLDISIANSVQSIGSKAFSGCSSLTSITIPNSVTSIERSAFSGCSSLVSITIPFIGDAANKGVYDNQYSFGFIFGTSSYAGGTAVKQKDYNSTSSITYYIPLMLRSVTVTGGDIINGCAFDNCSKLTSITMPDSVTCINYMAFSGCSGLTSITIPNSVTTIRGFVFSGCSGLTSITIPDSVTSIGSDAFEGCTDLTDIDYSGTKSQWNAISKDSNWNFGTGNYTIHCTDGDIAKE